MSLPIDPSFVTTGPEWSVGTAAPAVNTPAAGKFEGVLGEKVAALAESQNEASLQAQALATGEATDPSEVIMAVEKARLEMQLATTLRNKGTEAIQELMRTQV